MRSEPAPVSLLVVTVKGPAAQLVAAALGVSVNAQPRISAEDATPTVNKRRTRTPAPSATAIGG